MPHRSIIPIVLIPMAVVGLALVFRKAPQKEPTASEAGRRLQKEAKPAPKKRPRSK